MSETEDALDVSEPLPEPAVAVELPAGPRWQSLATGTMDQTDVMVLPGGYLVRSVWQIQGRYSMSGASMVFVAGDPPAGFGDTADSGRVKVGGGAIVF